MAIAVQATSIEAAGPHSPGDALTGHRATLLPLTGIRFFAALYVVLYHSKFSVALSAAGFRHAGYFIANGYLAVLLFFLLSGFILAYTYSGQIGAPRDKRRFGEARFARIWPLYVASLLFSSLFLHSTPSAARALATLCMVQAWNPANVDMAGTWNFVCWTLSTEAFFYVTFPFVQSWLEQRSRRFQGLFLAAMLVLSIVFATGRHVFGYPLAEPFLHIPLALVHTPEFFIGVCLGNLYLRRNQRRGESGARPRRFRFGTGFWTWGSLLVSVALLSQPSSRIATFTTVSFAVLLFGLATEQSLPRAFLSHRWLVLGGQISYGMYLLQWPCKFMVNRACELLHANSVSFRFVADLLVLTLLSIAGYYMIEVPARKVIRDFFARSEHVV